jgi:lysophospholipase L1-like esterase
MNRLFPVLLTVLFASWVLAQTTAPSSAPALVQGGPGLPLATNPALPTLWIVGDSTASNTANGALGWGTPFAKYFDTTKINVVNRARGGRSSRSFQVEGLWNAVLEVAKPGDFMIVQMGHNDGGDINNRNGRPSLPGTGEESQEITKADGSKEVVHTYGWYMRKYITDAKAKGIHIIVASSVPHLPRQPVEAGAVETRFVQVAWAEEVAKAMNVPFIHVNKIIMSKYVGMDPQEIRTKYFTPPGDGTHTNPVGADLNAQCVVEGIKMQKDLELNKYLRDAAQ